VRLPYHGLRLSVDIDHRAMNDADGPRVARHFYARLLENDTMDEGSVAYALDSAIAELRRSGVPPSRWATFIHMGA
jgi:hypothetical protein